MRWKWKSKKIIKRTQIPEERQFGTLWNLCRWRPRIPWPVAIVTDSGAGWRPTKTPERLAHYGICVGLQATDSGHIICTHLFRLCDVQILLPLKTVILCMDFVTITDSATT